MLALTIVGIITAVFVVGIFLLVAVGIWALVDAFLIPGMVQNQKDDVRKKLTLEALATQGALVSPA